MAVVKKEHSLPPDHPVYKEGWTTNVGGLQGTEPKNESSEAKPRRGGFVYRGFAKADDPIYKEGWSIHIGPLLGSTPAAPEASQPSETPQKTSSLAKKNSTSSKRKQRQKTRP